MLREDGDGCVGGEAVDVSKLSKEQLTNVLKQVEFPKVICIRLEEFRKIWFKEK